MAQRSAWLVVIVGVLAQSAFAQTSEEIADAIKRLEGPREDARAIEFLIDAGKEAVRPLVLELARASNDAKSPRYERILRALRAIGPAAASTTQQLVELMYELEGDAPPQKLMPSLRLAARVRETIEHLVRYLDQRHSEELLPAVRHTDYTRMVEFLTLMARREVEHASLDTRFVCERMLAIELLPAEDRRAVPTLVEILNDDTQPRAVLSVRTEWRQKVANSWIWEAASEAIARIDPDHPKAVRGLALMVESADDPRDRVRAAQALGRHGEAAKDQVDVLLAALDSDDDRLVAEAVTALGMIGVTGDAVLERLRTLTEDPRPAIAARAKAAMRVLEKRGC